MQQGNTLTNALNGTNCIVSSCIVHVANRNGKQFESEIPNGTSSSAQLKVPHNYPNNEESFQSQPNHME